MTILLPADGSNGAGQHKIKILVVEANAVSRSCTAAALEDVLDGVIMTANTLSGYVGSSVPDVVILPSSDPQGAVLVQSLNTASYRWPKAALIALVDLGGVEPLLRTLVAGARAILPTSVDGEAIALAIKLIRCGMVVVPGDLLASLAPRSETAGGGAMARSTSPTISDDGAAVLTQRQKQVLQLLAKGLSNRAIAERLAISESTVKVHVRAIMAQSGVTNRTQIVAQLLANGTGSLPKS
ncbi:helix-turn-helix transcriptional regulator [Novosphingobium sp. M1R2S20]|uniref:Response regulator transcription factor n=1 Tax=Novosphingobium rhizovicinum TaxID=3228928 RepID=A0ABV3RG16_9SPHN